MPVLDHEVHERTRTDDSHRYGCHNRVGHSPGYYAPNREYIYDGNFVERHKWVQDTMSRGCRYDRSTVDNRCEGCNHVGAGEAYSASVHAAGG